MPCLLRYARCATMRKMRAPIITFDADDAMPLICAMIAMLMRDMLLSDADARARMLYCCDDVRYAFAQSDAFPSPPAA